MTGFNSPDGKMHPQDRRNLIIFAVLSILVWFSYDHYVLQPKLDALKAAQARAASLPSMAAAGGAEAERPRADVIAASARIPVKNDRLFGSLSLTGGRIDDISLADHYKTLDKNADNHVVLFTPPGARFAKYAEFGWLPGAGAEGLKLPDSKTVWRVAPDSAAELTAGAKVKMVWDNGQGLSFARTVALDDNSAFTVTQDVTNNTGREIALYPYALVAQRGLPEEYYGAATVHEGPIGYIGGDLVEHTYKKIAKEPRDERNASSGWIGITEKYWLAALIPSQTEESKYRFLFTPSEYKDQAPLYQSDIVGAVRTAKPGETVSTTQHLFAGAKDISALKDYETTLGVKHFDLAVDFGLWYFLTKPLFYILDFLAHHVGNFGIAIIILTIMVRGLVFPLANTSYRSFAKMKKIAPEMKEMRDKYGHDKAELQQALVKLYEKEKVNPMAGCFPILIQIPIFFALFKVFSVTIEMRHAPFYGWIEDLSQHDPTTIFNLFGLIPWNPPGFLMIGAWPCLMLFFMLIQKQMNPPPQDKAQAMMMTFMPFFITYILAKFAAGLVIYWTFSNALSIVQQYIIMRSMGVKVTFFHRPQVEKDLEKQVADGPAIHPGLVVAEHQAEQALEDAVKPISPPKPRKKKKK